MVKRKPWRYSVPAMDFDKLLIGVKVRPGREIAQITCIGANEIIRGITAFIRQHFAYHHNVPEMVVAHGDNIPRFPCVVGGRRVAHQPAAGIRLHIAHKIIDPGPGSGTVAVPKPVPTASAPMSTPLFYISSWGFSSPCSFRESLI